MLHTLYAILEAQLPLQSAVYVCVQCQNGIKIYHIFFHSAQDELAWKLYVSEIPHVFLSTEMVKMNKAFSPHEADTRCFYKDTDVTKLKPVKRQDKVLISLNSAKRT